MKRRDAEPRSTRTLVQQRALVRVLIEQNGWSPPDSTCVPASNETDAHDNSLPDNVILFPITNH
jgi:hypothetical protein